MIVENYRDAYVTIKRCVSISSNLIRWYVCLLLLTHLNMTNVPQRCYENNGNVKRDLAVSANNIDYRDISISCNALPVSYLITYSKLQC